MPTVQFLQMLTLFTGGSVPFSGCKGLDVQPAVKQ